MYHGPDAIHVMQRLTMLFSGRINPLCSSQRVILLGCVVSTMQNIYSAVQHGTATEFCTQADDWILVHVACKFSQNPDNNKVRASVVLVAHHTCCVLDTEETSSPGVGVRQRHTEITSHCHWMWWRMRHAK